MPLRMDLREQEHKSKGERQFVKEIATAARFDNIKMNTNNGIDFFYHQSIIVLAITKH